VPLSGRVFCPQRSCGRLRHVTRLNSASKRHLQGEAFCREALLHALRLRRGGSSKTLVSKKIDWSVGIRVSASV
jgi:hypothetical protein